MATMSEATVKVHEESKEKWRATAQTLVDDYGGVEDLRHMAHFHRGRELMFSCAVEFQEDEMAEAVALLGLMFGCVPEVTSMTLHLDSKVRKHTDPALVDTDAVVTMTLEMEHINDAVLFDRRSTLTSYKVDCGLLVTDEVAPEIEAAEIWIYQMLESTSGNVATGNTVVTADCEIESFLPLLQSVEYANATFGWEFLPTEWFELSIINRLLTDYTSEQFLRARDNHGGMQLMTPRLVFIDRLEEL